MAVVHYLCRGSSVQGRHCSCGYSICSRRAPPPRAIATRKRPGHTYGRLGLRELNWDQTPAIWPITRGLHTCRPLFRLHFFTLKPNQITTFEHKSCSPHQVPPMCSPVNTFCDLGGLGVLL